jgi:hypothetical protein
VPVSGENGAAGGGNDEVMGPSALALSGGVGQQGCMVLGHRPVVCVDRYDGEDLVEECSLSCLPRPLSRRALMMVAVCSRRYSLSRKCCCRRR